MSSISGSSGGVSSVGTVGSTPNSAGASVSGSTLTLQPADGTNAGLLSILNQTITGVKTFSSNLSVSGNLTVTGTTTTSGTLTWNNTGANTGVLGIGSGLPFVQMNGGNCKLQFTGGGDTIQFKDSNASSLSLQSVSDNYMTFNSSAKTINATQGFLAIKSVTQNATATVTVSATADNRRLFTNVGSTTTQVFYNLPAATVGLDYSFVCEDSGGMVIDANGTNQIRYVSTAGTGILGGAGGTITTTVQGAAIRISCHKATVWSVQSVIGTIGAAATNWVVT